MNLQARLKGGRVGKGRRVESCTAYRESRHSPSMLFAGFVRRRAGRKDNSRHVLKSQKGNICRCPPLMRIADS
jgi:hypothetical protein